MIFHSFTMSDVEDPYLYAAFPISEWQDTEQGKWVMKHGHNLTFDIYPDPTSLGYCVTIKGELNLVDATYFTLKYK
jgi:hypothetical protein